MVVNDYLTLFLTLQSWIISNKLFYLLSSANLLALPLVIVIFITMNEALHEGEDEGNKGLLSLNRSAVGLVLAIAAFIFGVVPTKKLNLGTLTYNDVRSEQCGVSVTKPGTNTGTSWDSSFESMGGQTALVPVWWKLMHGMSIGVTNAAVSSIPCSYDVMRSQLKLSEVSISDPALQQETQQFYEQCFANAKSSTVYTTYQNQQLEAISKFDLKCANWLGDEYFFTTNAKASHTTYKGIQALDPVPSFPYKASRDGHYNELWAERLSKKEADKKAYPMCDEWWLDKQYGLRDRLAKEIETNSPEIYRDVMDPQGWFDELFKGEKSPDERKDMLVRRALNVENINATGRTTRGYGAVIDKTNEKFFSEMWGSTAGTAGTVAGRVFSEPVFFVIKEALPIFQALFLSMIIIAVPIVLPLALYQWRVLLTMTVAYFGLQFFTFWWEWCRSLESKLLTSMYSSHDFDVLNPVSYSAGAMNTMDGEIIKVVLLMLYVIVPMAWLGILGFAGYQITNLGSSFNQGLGFIKASTEKGLEKIPKPK